MKALFLTDSVFPDGVSAGATRSLMAQLHALEIKYDRLRVANIPSAAVMAANYDFVVIPYVGGGYYSALINNAGLTIPVIVMELGNVNVATLGSTPGIVQASWTTTAEEFFTSTMFSSTWMPSVAQWWTMASPGVALMTSAAISPLTSAAQTNSGKVCAWYTTKAGAGHLYVSSLGSLGQPMLALYLQTAYKLGDFTKVQINSLRRLPVSIDMDHLTGDGFRDLPTLNRWLSMLPAKSVTWCGITSGYGQTLSNITAMAADVKAALQAAVVAGKLKFCYHDHRTGHEVFTGVWPFSGRGGSLVDIGLTKAQQDGFYQEIKAAWEAAGFKFDTPIFYVPAGNEWNEDTLRLMQPQANLSASTDNATVKQGYGATMVRHAVSNVCSRPCNPPGTSPRNIHKVRDYFAGMTFVPGGDIGPTPPLTLVVRGYQFQSLLAAIHFGFGIYLHDEDFVDPTDPATGKVGPTMMQQLLDLKSALPDVCDFWADQTQHSVGVNA